VSADDDVVCPRCVLLDGSNEPAKLMGQVPACGVGDVEGGGTCLDHLTQDLVQELRVRPVWGGGGKCEE
jgi:hypothetical protein